MDGDPKEVCGRYKRFVAESKKNAKAKPKAKG